MTTDNNVLIKVDGLQKSFGNIEVLKGIDAEIKKGDVITLNLDEKTDLRLNKKQTMETWSLKLEKSKYTFDTAKNHTIWNDDWI